MAASTGKQVILSADRIASRHELLVYLLLAGSVLFLFLFSMSYVIFSSDPLRIAGLQDSHLLNGPALFFMDSRLAEGDFPLWNPHTYSGVPFAAHPLSQAFYPPNLIRSALTGAGTPIRFFLSLYIMVFFHQLLMSFGLYALLRREGVSTLVCFVVSVSVPFSSNQMEEILGQVPFLCTIAWTPIILFCLRSAVLAQQMRRSAGWLIIGGLLYGFQIMAGFQQAAMYATVIYVAYVALQVGTRFESGRFSIGAAALRNLQWAGPMLFFGLVGVAVSMAFLLPAVELIELSARSTENFAKYGSEGRFVRISLISALVTRETLWGPNFFSQLFGLGHLGAVWIYLNVGLLICATASALVISKRPVFIYGFLLWLTLDLTVGPPMPLATLFDTFSFFAASSPLYAAGLVGVPLGILSAFGLQAVFDRASSRGFSRPELYFLAGVGLLLILFMSEPPQTMNARNFTWSLLPVCVLVLISFCSHVRYFRLLLCAVLLVESAVCARVSVRHILDAPETFISRQFHTDAEVLTTTPTVEVRRGRVMWNPLLCNHHLFSLVSAINGYDPLILDRTIQMLSNPGEESIYYRTLYVRENTNLQAAAMFKRFFWLVPTYVKGPMPEKRRMFPPARVVFLTEGPEIGLLETALEDVPTGSIAVRSEENVIWTARSRRPSDYAYGVQHIGVSGIEFPDQTSALLVTYRSSGPGFIRLSVEGAGEQEVFGLGRFALPVTDEKWATIEFPLPDFSQGDIHVYVRKKIDTRRPHVQRVSIVYDMSDESDRIHVIESSPDLTVLEVRDAPGPRAVVFTDMYYPGWKAFVDGEPAPLYMANGGVKAVVIPEGTHEVRFVFRPWRVWAGVTVSIVVLVAGVASLFWCFRREKE